MAEKYDKAEKERVKINDKYIRLSQRLKDPIVNISNSTSNTQYLKAIEEAN